MALAGAAGGRITAGAGANLIGIHAADRNPDATCYVGNIDMQATEDLVWELFVQAGPVGKLTLGLSPCILRFPLQFPEAAFDLENFHYLFLFFFFF